MHQGKQKPGRMFRRKNEERSSERRTRVTSSTSRASAAVILIRNSTSAHYGDFLPDRGWLCVQLQMVNWRISRISSRRQKNVTRSRNGELRLVRSVHHCTMCVVLRKTSRSYQVRLSMSTSSVGTHFNPSRCRCPHSWTSLAVETVQSTLPSRDGTSSRRSCDRNVLASSFYCRHSPSGRGQTRRLQVRPTQCQPHC